MSQLVLSAVHVLSMCCLLASAQKFDGVVRAVGDGRYEAYMIPPYAANHASFLERLPSGELLMAWFSGTAEGANNCSIVLARLPPNGSQWSKAALTSRRNGYSDQNPVLWRNAATNELLLFHSQQPASSSLVAKPTSEVKAHIWLLKSADGRGLNWTAPTLLFARDGEFDRNRIITGLDGSWIFPVYFSVSGDKNQFSQMKISADHTTWKGYDVADSNYLIQPSVIRPSPNKMFLRAFFRDRRSEHIYWASSADEAHTWTKPEQTGLPNNNAAIEATVLANGHVALVYNPTTHDRFPLRISISEDGGKTWPHSRDLETGPSAAMATSSTEYSYPTVLQSWDDGLLHVSYTFNRHTIKYVRFPEDWVLKGQ